MLSGVSGDVVLVALTVSIVVLEVVRDPPGLPLLLVRVEQFRGVVIPRGVSVLRHGAHVRHKGLRGASVLVGQVSQAAGQVRGCGQAVALSAGHFVRGTLHRGSAGDGNRLSVQRSHGVRRRSHLRQRTLGSSGDSGSMADERRHEI